MFLLPFFEIVKVPFIKGCCLVDKIVLVFWRLTSVRKDEAA